LKAIILAAGRGTRLGDYAKGMPKAMLDFAGKPLLATQLKVLRAAGVNDITVVTGFASKKIAFDGVNYVHNPDFATTNMVESLIVARDELKAGALVCYGDIIYEPRVLKAVMKAKADAVVAVDYDYLDYWKARLGDEWENDTESLRVVNGKITELGGSNPSAKERQCRYVGLLKFSANGAKLLLETYYAEKRRHWESEKPWLNSPSFKQAFMTDLLNAFIARGNEVRPVEIERGWMEFDTADDYEKASAWLADGSIKRFFDPRTLA
jgi:choline kinase